MSRPALSTVVAALATYRCLNMRSAPEIGLDLCRQNDGLEQDALAMQTDQACLEHCSRSTGDLPLPQYAIIS